MGASGSTAATTYGPLVEDPTRAKVGASLVSVRDGNLSKKTSGNKGKRAREGHTRSKELLPRMDRDSAPVSLREGHLQECSRIEIHSNISGYLVVSKWSQCDGQWGR